jgi:hypothetical protein
MVRVNGCGYLERRVARFKYRNVWLVKATERSSGVAYLSHAVSFPESWIGKRIRFKVEVVDDEKEAR